MRTFKNLTENVQEAITMPYGTDFNRPANPEEGMVRYNTTQDALEFYNGTIWSVLGDSQVTPDLTTQGLVLNLDASDSNSYSGSGNTWADLSSKGNDFTLSSTVYSNLGGGSFEFGANKAAYVTGNSDFAPGTGDYSLSAWVYPTTLNSAHNAHAFWTQAVGGYNYYIAALNNSGNAVYTIDWNNYASTNNTSINNWAYVTISRISGTQKIYINANVGATSTNTTNLNQLYNPTLGNYTHNYTQLPFVGNIAAVHYYSGKGLTDAEVTQNFNATKTRFGL